MKPGRDLDLKIARKIFGFKAKKVKGLMGITRYVIEDESDDWEVGFIRDNLPHYSTNIEDAWKIVDKYHRFVLTKSEMPERYYAEIIFHLGMGEFKEYKAEAETAPLAICKVALESLKEFE